MAAIFEYLECGHLAVYKQEDGLEKCPECGDIHVDVTYGVPYHMSSWRPGNYKSDTDQQRLEQKR